MKKRDLMVCSGFTLLLSGCWMVGPDYQAREVRDALSPLPDAGVVAGQKDNTRSAISRQEVAAWWKVFKDAQLNSLMEQAFTNNLSLKAAVSRVRQARARLAIAKGAWEPTLDAVGGINRFRTSENGQTGRKMTETLYSAGFDAAWELDIFGGTARNVEAEEAALEGAIAGMEQVWVTQAAEVALNYAQLRTIQQRLKVAQGNLKIQDETLQILLSRLKSGIGDDLAVQQARYNVETTRATIPGLLAQEESCYNALAVLVGREPGGMRNSLQPQGQLVMEPRSLAGLSAEYLRRRPDLRQAERAVAEQSARIGVAKADLYPKFRLIGSIGLESLETEEFFKNGSVAWSFGPSVSWPIFHGGTIRANIALQDARYEESCVAYDQALLSAVREIRNALSSYSQEYHRNQALGKAVEAAQAAVNISQDLYKSGLRDFNNVLDAQRSLLSLEESFTVSQGNIATQLIQLYKALGGGWSSWGDEKPDSPKKPEKIEALLAE